MNELEKSIDGPACDACGEGADLTRIDESTVLCADCINEFKGNP